MFASLDDTINKIRHLGTSLTSACLKFINMAQKCIKLVNGCQMQGALIKSYFLHTIVSGEKMRVPNSKEKFISSKKTTCSKLANGHIEITEILLAEHL